MKSYVTVREALEAENIDARSASRKGGSRLSLSNFQEGHVSRRAAASTPSQPQRTNNQKVLATVGQKGLSKWRLAFCPSSRNMQSGQKAKMRDSTPLSYSISPRFSKSTMQRTIAVFVSLTTGERLSQQILCFSHTLSFSHIFQFSNPFLPIASKGKEEGGAFKL